MMILILIPTPISFVANSGQLHSKISVTSIFSIPLFTCRHIFDAKRTGGHDHDVQYT